MGFDDHAIVVIVTLARGPAVGAFYTHPAPTRKGIVMLQIDHAAIAFTAGTATAFGSHE